MPPVEVVAESPDKLSAALLIHGTLVASYLENASDRIRLFDLAGRPAGTVDLPAIGSVSGISGRPEDDEMFVGFSSFVYPPANYRYDFAAKALAPFGSSERRMRSRGLRDGTGVVSLEGRHEGVDVPGAPQRVAAGRPRGRCC